MALPWAQHLPQVVFHHNGADARLVASHGASFATVCVACSCPSCEKRPLAPFRTGGCVLGLGDWALHVGLKAASLAEVQVIQPGSNEKVPLAFWLQSASLEMGGESLRRRQVNVFHWNGKLVPDSHDAVTKLSPRYTTSTTLPTAYEGLGSWRAATIRGYDPTTCRFEVKYHDEPKRSQAHLWLPLAVLHFARNPPATATAIRSSPEIIPAQLASPFCSSYAPRDAPHLSQPLPVMPPLPCPPLPLPIVLQPQLCVYGQQHMAPAPPPPLLPPPLLPKEVMPLAPLLGSFHSMPTAPASPQASRQGSPQHAGFPRHDPSALTGDLEAGSPQRLSPPLVAASDEMLRGSARQRAQPQPQTLPQNGFASCVQLVVAGGGDSMAPTAPAAATASRSLLECHVSSFVSLSTDSDSGSSKSIGTGGGDVSGSDAGSEGSDGVEGSGGSTPRSGSRWEAAAGAVVAATAAAAAGDSEWQLPMATASSGEQHISNGGVTSGARWSPVPERCGAQPLARMPPAFPPMCLLSGFLQVPSGLGVGGLATGSGASDPAGPSLLHGSDCNGAAAPGAVVVHDAAAVAPPAAAAAAAADWAPGTIPYNLDDDLAALYADLCSEEANEDQLPPLQPPSAATAATATAAFALPAAASTVPSAQPPLPMPQLQPDTGATAAAAATATCRTMLPPAFMQPGAPPPPNTAVASDQQIHPVLLAALLERHQQHQQKQQQQALMAMAMAMEGQTAAAAQQGLPTCLPYQVPPPAPPGGGVKRPCPPVLSTAAPTPSQEKMYGSGACGFGGGGGAASAPGLQSSGSAALLAMLNEWEGLAGSGVGVVWDGLAASCEGVACEPALTRRRLA